MLILYTCVHIIQIGCCHSTACSMYEHTQDIAVQIHMLTALLALVLILSLHTILRHDNVKKEDN